MKIVKIPTLLALFFSVACGGSQSTPQNSNESIAPANDDVEVAQEPAAEMDIVATAINAGQFNTLVAALQAADLVGALQGDGPFTVFAPTDAAFAKLPEGTVEALLQDKEKLAQILTYHVVSGQVMAADVVSLTEATTLQGQTVAIDTSNGVKVGGANVVTADIVTSNGVIHVIDTVLIPQ
jgi:uncharacterized surface protein with fasciclin (FAS1) repeats